MSRSKKVRVIIDVTDWGGELEKHGMTKDDIVSLVLDDGYTTGQVARAAVFHRATGNAEEDVLRSDKLLLYAGAAQNVTQRMKKLKREVTMPSGQSYMVREAVGKPGRGSDGDEGAELDKETIATMSDRSFVLVDSEEALERARHYVLKNIPGHIFERLKVITVAGGDVKEVVKELHKEIDRMVGRLV